jgi:hypothetical protein
MDPPRLTVTTIRYLYATTWLPCDEREKTVAVPGGQTTALDTAGNLLHTALWNLRRQGVFDFEQLRPVEVEQVVVLGGRSFSSFEFRDPGQDLRGLEGALIMAARDVASGGGFADRQIDRVTGEDGHGVRRLVTAMPLHNMAPWATVVGYCFAEAEAAGLVEHKGWAIKRVAITDPPAIESLRARNDELRATRAADMEREPELHNAVIADCLHAIKNAYGTLD